MKSTRHRSYRYVRSNPSLDLYHATTAGPTILQTGLKSLTQIRKMGGTQTLGLNEHPDFVSTTPLYEGALRIAALLQAWNAMKMDPVRCVRWWRSHYLSRLQRIEKTDPQTQRREAAQEILEDVAFYWSDLDSYASSVIVEEEYNEELDDWVELERPVRISEVAHKAGRGLDKLINMVPRVLSDAYPEFIFAYYASLKDEQDAETLRKPESIGIIHLKVCVDGIASYKDGMRPIIGLEQYASQQIDFGCRPSEYRARNPDPVLRDSHVAWIKLDRNEKASGDAYEILVCPEDTQVLSFEPVLDWKKILDPQHLPDWLRG